MKLLIAVLFFAYARAGVLVLRIAGYRTPTPFVVLMYHSVKRDERKRFARQMDRLVRVGCPVYADFDASGRDGTRHIAVTFDDAHHSVFENAFPILRERSIPATVFVPTHYIGGAPGWITDSRHRDADERGLTIDELRELRRGGVLIGSHSVTHRRMTELSQAEMVEELTESRNTLAKILGENVHVFALPYGSGNADVAHLAARAGYTRLFLNVPGHGSGDSPVRVVGRIRVDPTDWALEYYLKIRGAYRWLPSAIAAKRRVRRVLQAAFPRKRERRRAERATGAIFPVS